MPIYAAFVPMYNRSFAAVFCENCSTIGTNRSFGRISMNCGPRTYKGKRIVTYHNSWPYFAKRFEVNMSLFLEPKPGIPPTPAHLAEVIAKMKAEHTRLIVVEPHLSRKTAEAVAGHTEAQLLDFAPYPGVGKSAGEGYIEWMDSLIHALVKGFEATK